MAGVGFFVLTLFPISAARATAVAKSHPRPVATHGMPCRPSGASRSPFSQSSRQKKRRKRTKQRKSQPAWSPPLLLYLLWGGLSSPSDLHLTLPRCQGTRGLFLRGLGGLGPSLPALGGGNLYPLASCRASRFFGQTLDCAKWELRQFAHLAVTCLHVCPFPAVHPSTLSRFVFL